MQGVRTEQLLPVLSPGRHRNPRRGACFMEYASYLAGLRWSDHPSCTHPSVAALARLINDVTSDEARARLTAYIPSVVGLVGTDPRVPLVVSSLAASSALPVSSEIRQRALAAGLLRCERLLLGYDGPVVERTRIGVRRALDRAPAAEEWARAFEGRDAVLRPRPMSVSDEAILRASVIGIAEACVGDADDRLVRLLATVIAETKEILRPDTIPVAQEPVLVRS
jgi:hypothetical protein